LEKTEMLNPRVVLHATDFSQRSAFAFEVARSLARAEGAKLVLLHVVPSVGDSIARQKAERALAHLVKSDPHVAMEWTVLSGDPAANIAWMANEARADLIVLAASGKSGWSALLARSVSRNVERRSRCPVVRLEVPSAWLSEKTNEHKRCVYCDAPTVQSTAPNRSKNRYPIISPARNGSVALVEPADIVPQI
jgi:nucleotide-binding universal stress UspA family protein